MSDVAPLVAEPTGAEEERKTSYIELFFDLVFVFAFTQVTALILEDTSVEGFLRAALVLAMVWWAWSAYAWMTNAIDVENAVTRLIMFTAMAAGFFMALAVPDAFQDEAAWFAVAYFVVRVLNSTLYAWGVRDDPGTPARRSGSRRGSSPPRSSRSSAASRIPTTARGSGSRRSSSTSSGRSPSRAPSGASRRPTSPSASR